jgi:hypothetical protein
MANRVADRILTGQTRIAMLEIAEATKEKQLYVVLHAVKEIRRLTESSR